MSALQKQAGAQVIRYSTGETSLSSRQAAEDGPRQRRALRLSVPGTGLPLEVIYTQCC